MKTIENLFKEAERAWRTHIKKYFPLRATTKIEQSSNNTGTSWSFSTDLKKIFVNISKDNTLEEQYKTIINKYWNEEPETLLKDTMHYLLWHEIYHPIEAPKSKSDSTKIHQAIRRGALKAEPTLSSSEQLGKVMLSQNMVKDFILDNRFYLDNLERKFVKKDIIPVWDVLELHNKKTETNLFTITRFMYGVLYGPETVHPFFEEKTGTNGIITANKALSKLTQEHVDLTNKEQLAYYTTEIRKIFTSQDRYTGIERMMSILSPYINKNMPQGGKNMQQGEEGDQSGGSPQSILQDLLDDMSEDEQEEFTNDLVINEEQLIQLAQDMEGQELEGNDYNMLKNLDMYAFHEFYKKNHPEIKILSGKKLGKIEVIGKKEYWKLKSSKVIAPHELKSVSMKRLNALQKRSKMPWLIKLNNNMYRINEYELQERNINGIAYKDLSLDTPDILEFYLDSSGSMFDTIPAQINDNSRINMVYHVLYGFLDGIHKTNKIIGKTTQVRFHNFAEEQKSSEIVSIREFLEGNYTALQTIYKPDNGYSYEDLNIQEYTYNYTKRAYVIVTDGNLVITGRSKREAKKMKTIANKPNHMMLHFEIGATYDLGKMVKNDPSITYLQVHNQEEMFAKGLEVLIKGE